MNMANLNSSFSTINPRLQTYIDATSLGLFKLCPRKYYYSILCKYQPQLESAHLTFGLLLHSAIEHYWQHRLEHHKDHETALGLVVHETLKATWDSTLNRPWQSDIKTKNRFTLIRTIVWYLDKFKDDPIEILFIRGRPAVELPFLLDSGIESQFTGEPFILCGKIDRLGKLNGDFYVVDVKSTQRTLSQSWADRFTPDNQFTIYYLASREIFKVEAVGLILDGCQVVQTFSDFQRYLISRSDFQLQEWQHDLAFHLNNLDMCAKNDHWPMNDAACDMYGGCPFRDVCAAKNPSIRQTILNTSFKKRVWDPHARRLDY